MAVVAVAGGNGHLGRTIVDMLLDTTRFKVIVLGRKGSERMNPSATLLTVDYSDVGGTAQLLTDNNIHTIISTLPINTGTTSCTQVNLIKAAAKSGTTRRFITSEWSIIHPKESPSYHFREEAVAELRNTDLEWTRFNNGYFLDYWGMPHVKSYLGPLSWVVDIANSTAGIPGTGDEPLALTYTFDVAKFVAAFLELPKWEEETYCYGDKSTWNSIVKVAEKARGSRFITTYDSIEKLNRGEITELPSHSQTYEFFPKPALQRLLATFGRWVIAGRFDIPADKSLNAKFPEIETLKVRDMLALWNGPSSKIFESTLTEQAHVP